MIFYRGFSPRWQKELALLKIEDVYFRAES